MMSSNAPLSYYCKIKNYGYIWGKVAVIGMEHSVGASKEGGKVLFLNRLVIIKMYAL